LLHPKVKNDIGACTVGFQQRINGMLTILFRLQYQLFPQIKEKTLIANNMVFLLMAISHPGDIF
jgi:hypothetical protein